MAMKQKTRSLLTLLGLLAALAAVGHYAYHGVHRKQADEGAKEHAARVFDFDESQLAGLTITAKGQTTVLAADKQRRWHVVSPVQSLADEPVVRSLIEGLLALRSEEVVEKDGAELAKYGLDRPSVRIVARLEDGGERTLRVGRESAFDGSVYLSTSDSADALRARGGFKWALEKNTFDLRDKRVLPFEDSAVRGLTVRAGADRYQLEKREGRWRMVSPIADRADEAEVARILEALRGLRALEFVTDTATPSQHGRYGLDAPRLEVSLALEGGGTMTLIAGEGTGDDGVPEAFARRREAVFVAAVPASIFSELESSPSRLRDKTLVSVDPAQVHAIRFGFGEASVTVERAKDGEAGDGWKLAGAADGEAPTARISGLLPTLAGLKADDFADENPADLGSFGLASPERTLTLLDQAGQQLGALSIGRTEGSRTFVMGSDGGRRVFGIEQARLGDLPTSPADLEPPAAPPPGEAVEAEVPGAALD